MTPNESRTDPIMAIEQCIFAISPIKYPRIHPATIAIIETAMYFRMLFSDKMTDGMAEQLNAIDMEYAAPRIPYCGTKTKNEAKKATSCIDPNNINSFGLPKLLNLDIALEAIALGSMPPANTRRTNSSLAYSVPIMERIAPGAVSKAEIIGAVKLSPSLMLPDDKSKLATEDAGIAINAMLDAKPPAAILIITAM